MDGLGVNPLRFSYLDQYSGWPHRKLIDPAPRIAEDREGSECST